MSTIKRTVTSFLDQFAVYLAAADPQFVGRNPELFINEK